MKARFAAFVLVAGLATALLSAAGPGQAARAQVPQPQDLQSRQTQSITTTLQGSRQGQGTRQGNLPAAQLPLSGPDGLPAVLSSADADLYRRIFVL
jgi:hypothetical protein